LRLRGELSRLEGSISFLKKRNKKLLPVSRRTEFNDEARNQRVTSKSFLVLFFKKELLPSLPLR
jgi:hypothetical protein